VTDLIPFAGSTNDEADDSDLRKNVFQKGEDDGRRPKQGPITRSMARHIKAQDESEAPMHIKMVTTLSLCEHC